MRKVHKTTTHVVEKRAAIFELGVKHAKEGRPYRWRKHTFQNDYYRGYHSVTEATRVAMKPPRTVFGKAYRAVRRCLEKLPGRFGGDVTRPGNWYVYFSPGQRSKKLTYWTCLSLANQYGGKVYHRLDVEV